MGAPPELGDRVANLCANGVPFGARGTVVAIHDATEGCVEVLLDEEFIGEFTPFEGSLFIRANADMCFLQADPLCRELAPISEENCACGTTF